MCTFHYTVLCSLIATQGGDAGAISSILPLHKGGGEPGYCVHCIQNGHLYTKTVRSEGTTFSKKETMKALELRIGK